MYLLIDIQGQLSLEDHDNMKGFSIIDNSNPSNHGALLAIASPGEENHYWINIKSVIELSPKANDEDWLIAFSKMLKSAAPYGFVDMDKNLIKAHIENH